MLGPAASATLTEDVVALYMSTLSSAAEKDFKFSLNTLELKTLYCRAWA